jgi:transcriptional regulator with XRE-family HTH domain
LSEVHPIRRLRGERGWSQLELAYRAGLDIKTIVDIEHGRRHAHRSTLTCLAYAFGLQREELLQLLEEEGG